MSVAACEPGSSSSAGLLPAGVLHSPLVQTEWVEAGMKVYISFKDAFYNIEFDLPFIMQ